MELIKPSPEFILTIVVNNTGNQNIIYNAVNVLIGMGTAAKQRFGTLPNKD